MPELPEVETTLRALMPFLDGKCIERVDVRRPDLRWPVPADLNSRLAGQRVENVRRRAKYILADVAGGTLIIHLGMSGSIRILKSQTAPGPHDHVDLCIRGGPCLRYTDPRRFGAWLWTDEPPDSHPLLRNLGPEPWEGSLTAEGLQALARGRKTPVKAFIMDNTVLVGVGNIYATEALFDPAFGRAGRQGGSPGKEWLVLLAEIRTVLEEAIASGGSTLRDFSSGDGKPGYFAQSLKAYGRGGQPCMRCDTTLKELKIGGRASVYCPACQR